MKVKFCACRLTAKFEHLVTYTSDCLRNFETSLIEREYIAVSRTDVSEHPVKDSNTEWTATIQGMHNYVADFFDSVNLSPLTTKFEI